MKISQHGIDMIKEFEGCVLSAYYDSGGTLTIGYGHTANVYEGQHISLDEAEKYLRADLLTAETEVNAWAFHYHWDQNEFDSMVSFTYNCGAGCFRNLIKNGDRTKGQIAEAMLLYVSDGKDQLEGLKRRRERERSLFLCPVDIDDSEDYQTVDDIVDAIWAGKFGNDEERKEKLYEFFQNKVNERC